MTGGGDRRCVFCDGTGFVYSLSNGAVYAARCVCRLRKLDDGTNPAISSKIMETARRLQEGTLMGPKEISRLQLGCDARRGR